MLVNEDCSVKICDFGLARSISGVENSSLYLTGRRVKSHNSDQESGDDMLLKGSELARIHHKDETSNQVEEASIQMKDLQIEEQKTEKSEEEKRREMTRKLIRTKD